MAMKSEPQVRKDQESRKIFCRNGSAVAENTILKREKLARTLEKIAAEGKKAF